MSLTYTVPTRPWKDIVTFYQNLGQEHAWHVQPMRDVVAHLNASYGQALNATTSLATLIVTVEPVIRANHNVVQLTFANDAFTIEYWNTYGVKRITCQAQTALEAVAHFEELIQSIGWIEQKPVHAKV